LNPANNTGQQTLEVISKADQFNRWMYDTIRPYCRGNILEVGSGIGNISSFFVQDYFQITLSDIDGRYLQTLKGNYATRSNVKEIMLLNLEHDDFENAYGSKKNSFDTIFLLNVLEHIKDDEKAVQNCKYLLKDGGSLIILVPAYSWLYARLDKALAHYRRYTLRNLKGIFSKQRLTVKAQFYFNGIGIIAWSYAKVFRLSVVPSTEMKMYNIIVPFAKLVDKIVMHRIGLSAVIIGKK
jgi:2-polyprenyl-3-methyl-5-hydroxy-6-metoxy-1,4-benzoquinol methylase